MVSKEIHNSIAQGRSFRSLDDAIRHEHSTKNWVIVVLDDDPTGTQTVHDVPVITEWSEEILEKTLLQHSVVFVLTNSRSLRSNEAYDLSIQIGSRLAKVTKKINKTLLPISRSDSTLRGHYPIELDGLKKGLGWEKSKTLLVPAFFEGGRYTYKDTHYVKNGEDFIAAGETPFANDNTFGYTKSNLKEWIEEKTLGKIPKEKVASISITSIRKKDHTEIVEILAKNTTIIVNATSPYDLQVVALACLQQKVHIVFRTAASFVNAISGIRPKTFQIAHELSKEERTKGGLLVVGSYIPLTNSQLNYLKKNSPKLKFLELKVDELFDSTKPFHQIETLSREIKKAIEAGVNTVLYTSREVRSGRTREESLEIVNKVSSCLVAIVKQLTFRPKFLIVKGGITSSDIAVKALGVKSAKVVGQAMDGVPVWLLGDDSKFPKMPYIIFPGNVGDETSIHQLIQQLT